MNFFKTHFGIRSQLFLLTLGLVALALISADLILVRLLDQYLVNRIRQDLVIRAHLVEREAARLVSRPAVEWNPMAQELSRLAQARVSLLKPSGQVLGDSGVDHIQDMENHGDRPEILKALAGEQAAEIRHSRTLGFRMLYVSVPMKNHGHVLGVARLAIPLSEVDAAIRQIRGVMALSLISALGIVAIMAFLSAHRFSRKLRLMTESAVRMAGGQLSVRVRSDGSDEIALLGKSLDQLAERLSQVMEQLRNERDMLWGVLEGMQEGVLLLDAKGNLALTNPALRDMLLLRPDAVGKPLLEVIRNADLAEMAEETLSSRLPQTGETESQGLKPRRFLVTSSPLQGADEGMVLMVLVDVTQLRYLESMRKNFVANASHELRTPVAVVRSAAETLRSTLEGMEGSEGFVTFVDIIERNSQRLQRLIDDLLDLSRLESRAYQFHLERISMDSLLESLLGTYQDAAQKRAQRLSIDAGLREWRIHTDYRALEQILGNLLDNAVKYAKDGALITIQGQKLESHLRLEVRDDGPGIQEHHLHRLFERFYRLDPGRSRDMGGTGLGLAIVKHLTEALGGRAGVESVFGQGSCFYIELPVSGLEAPK